MRWRDTGIQQAVDAHIGTHVGGRVEIVGDHAITIRGFQERVPLLDGVAAEWNQLFDEAPQAGLAGGGYLQLQLRKVVVGAADLEVQDLELSAALDDGIEDGVEELRIDEVALGLDDDGVLRCV